MPRFDARKQAAVLAKIAEGYSVTAAAKETNVGRSTIYDRIEADEKFASAYRKAIDAGTEVLEDEARRRAVEGWDEPVYYLGQEVGYVRRYSHTLLIFLLKARKPEKYRERVDHRHATDGPIEIKLSFDPGEGGQ